MNKDISIFKKIKLFREYKKSIKLNRTELEQKFNIRIDRANRLYTVVNVPEEIIGEPYNLRKTDIDKISEKFIKEYSTEVSKFLDSINLKEMYEFYKIEKVNKYAYLVIFGFSLFRSNEYYNNIYFKILPTVLILITLSYFLFLR
jgi:hypothetical protein